MKKAFIKKGLACLLAALLLFTLPLSAFAATTNESVQSATTGVVQVRALYLDSNNNIWTGYTGTAFLINEEYLLTCDHVFDLSAEDLAAGQEAYGWTEKQIRDHSRVEIVVMRDVTIEASIVQESAIMDFAILKLSQKLYDRTYLPLRSSSEVQQTESIYSLGFPGGVSYWQDTNTWTSDDVTITAGYAVEVPAATAGVRIDSASEKSSIDYSFTPTDTDQYGDSVSYTFEYAVKKRDVTIIATVPAKNFDGSREVEPTKLEIAEVTPLVDGDEGDGFSLEGVTFKYDHSDKEINGAVPSEEEMAKVPEKPDPKPVAKKAETKVSKPAAPKPAPAQPESIQLSLFL